MSLAYFVQMAGTYGVTRTLRSIYHAKFPRPIREHTQFLRRVEGRRGLEVGGPSDVFRSKGLIPLYDSVGSLDNCNYGSTTLWAKHEPGRTFRFSERKPSGLQYLTDGSELSEIHDEGYEFVLSSHMLEHAANPLKALSTWKRILSPGGSLILLVPDKEWTFDHLRPTTSLTHLIQDFQANMGEDDMTHLPEVLEHLDMQRLPGWTRERLQAMLENNVETRGIHHHVFDPPLVRQMLEHVGFSVRLLRTAFANHIIAIAEKGGRHEGSQ